MTENVLSLRISASMKDRLDRLATSSRRSRSFLAAEALAEYLDRNEWQIAAIDEAVRKADEGVFVSHEAVTHWLSGWGSGGDAAPPTPDIDKRRP